MGRGIRRRCLSIETINPTESGKGLKEETVGNIEKCKDIFCKVRIEVGWQWKKEYEVKFARIFCKSGRDFHFAERDISEVRGKGCRDLETLDFLVLR